MPRYLVCHDYGMGGLWWWITADSEADVVERIAEVTVVGDPETIAHFEADDLREVDLADAASEVALGDLVAQRDAARGRPGYGRFAGMERVWFAMPQIYEDEDWWFELNPSGQTIRAVREQGEVRERVVPDGINPMSDLYDPMYDDREITEAEFEQVWDAASKPADVPES